MGKGSITLKGSRKRPWLELSRAETERVYLGSQIYQLRQAHPGPLEIFWDRLPTNGFYDLERARIQTDELWRAYELLYPRDERTLSRDVLDLCGLHGLTSLWLDCGTLIGRTGEIRKRMSPDDKALLSDWVDDLGFPVNRAKAQAQHKLIIPAASMHQLKKAMRPLVHVTMRHKLRSKTS